MVAGFSTDKAVGLEPESVKNAAPKETARTTAPAPAIMSICLLRSVAARLDVSAIVAHPRNEDIGGLTGVEHLKLNADGDHA